jgi:FKBP-type peptidyl-prolyl cis-trans isomerase
MRMNFFSLCIFLASLSSLFADWNPDPHHKKALEQCFRNLLINTQMGYVLYGEKPICTQFTMAQIELISLYNRKDFDFAILDRFAKYLDALSPTWKGNFVIKTLNKKGGWEVLFINRKAFLQCVRENLPLFQHILGPEVTPEGLLKEIIQTDQYFEDLLHDNNVLIGIVLGFGPQNALFGSRHEKLGLLLPVYPMCSIEEDCLLKRRAIRQPFEISISSFGFSSLEEEYEALSNKLSISTTYAEDGYPLLPTFGCLDSAESKTILNGYAQARTKIRERLNSPRFLENLFRDLDVEFHPGEQLSRLDFSFDEQTVLNALPLMFDQSWIDPEFHDAEWHQSFIEGLTYREGLLSFKEFCQLCDKANQAYEAFLRARNLRQADLFFQNLQQNKDTVCVVPGKVYYKVVDEGIDSEKLSEPSKVTLSYALEQIPHQKPLIGCYQEIALNDFLAGPIKCMLGMRLGETREVWIHPDFASSSPIPTGVHGKIQLLQVKPSPELGPLSKDPTFFTRAEESEDLLQKRFHELKRKLASAFGSAVGYGLGYGLDIGKIVKAFELQNDHRKLSAKEKEMVSSFYISLYEKQKDEECRLALEQFALLPPCATCIEKDRLYVQCEEEGSGEIVKKTDKVKLRWCFKNHRGTILSKASPTLDLKHSIPAFQAALPGHRVGSKLSLSIHPEWGFDGLSERFGDVFLSSDVEILSISRD